VRVREEAGASDPGPLTFGFPCQFSHTFQGHLQDTALPLTIALINTSINPSLRPLCSVHMAAFDNSNLTAILGCKDILLLCLWHSEQTPCDSPVFKSPPLSMAHQVENKVYVLHKLISLTKADSGSR
jgi:hypothetical protein